MLHPAEHRALRELHATTRQLRNHWRRLGGRLDDEYLLDGAEQAARLLGELEAHVGEQYDLHGRPAAQALGARLAGARGVSDLLLERNQAFRAALLDLQHVITLLAYLRSLAKVRHDEALLALVEAWERNLTPLEAEGRERVERIAADPDEAIAPADASALGRAGAKVGVMVGAAGEALDNSPIGRLSRRRAT